MTPLPLASSPARAPAPVPAGPAAGARAPSDAESPAAAASAAAAAAVLASTPPPSVEVPQVADDGEETKAEPVGATADASVDAGAAGVAGTAPPSAVSANYSATSPVTPPPRLLPSTSGRAVPAVSAEVLDDTSSSDEDNDGTGAGGAVDEMPDLPGFDGTPVHSLSSHRSSGSGERKASDSECAATVASSVSAGAAAVPHTPVSFPRITYRKLRPVTVLSSERDVCCFEDAFVQANGVRVLYQISVQHGSIPPAPSCVRAEVLLQAHVVEPLPVGEDGVSKGCRVTYLSHTDLCGKVGKYLVSVAIDAQSIAHVRLMSWAAQALRR